MSLLLSQCCDALPLHETDQNDNGFCADCKEGCAFDNADKFAAKVKNAPNLDALLVALKEFHCRFYWFDGVEVDACFDMTDLPTFGTEMVDHELDTHGVWSWDDTRKLIGTCTEDLEIVPRDDRGDE